MDRIRDSHLLQKNTLSYLVVQPFQEFVFGDHDALAELDLGETFGVDEFVGVCPGDTQESRHLGNAKHNGQLIVRCVGLHSCNVLSCNKILSAEICVLPQHYRFGFY